jgi:sugar phosphate isomerase/epimerase
VLRYSVDQVGLPGTTFAEDVRLLERLRVPAIGVLRQKLAMIGTVEARLMIDDAGLDVSVLVGAGGFRLEEPAQWPARIDDLRHALDDAAALGARMLLLTPGPPGSLSYEEAEARFIDLLGDILEEARNHDMVIAFEPNHVLRVDLGYVHTLHDALDLADTVNSPHFKVLAEVNNCWVERHLYANIAERVSQISLVQISDFAAGTLSTPHRVPLGEGIIPLARILEAFVSAGYAGYFDIEVLGPVVDELGGEECTRRSLRYLEHLEFQSAASAVTTDD